MIDKNMKKMKPELDKLNMSILKDIEDGVRWSDIAERRKVTFNYVSSVYQTYRKERDSKQYEKGGRVIMQNGVRLTDGQPSPVKTYSVDELPEADRKRLGLL